MPVTTQLDIRTGRTTSPAMPASDIVDVVPAVLGISPRPRVPTNAITFSDGSPLQFSDGQYLEFSTP